MPLPYGRHSLTDDDIAAVLSTLREGPLTGGARVASFERALAERCGVAHAVAVSSGTSALHLALASLGVVRGDNVVTTPLTFVATPNAAIYSGAKPIFADVGDDRCLDHESAGLRLTTATKAVIPVDYAGLPADIDTLAASLPASMPIVIDAAHSLGGRLRGRHVGGLGTVTTLSFHPVKQITTGEGGACLTDDGDRAERIRRLRNHGLTSTAAERTGRRWRYDVDSLGSNHRMTDIQAALGHSQLARLDSIVARRTELAGRYDSLLSRIEGLRLPPRPPSRSSAWHLYAVEVDERTFGMRRDDVIDGLRAELIEATLHYPAAHLLRLYRNRGHHPGEAACAEQLCARLVTLPLFPTMTEADQDDVVDALERLQGWTRRGRQEEGRS